MPDITTPATTQVVTTSATEIAPTAVDATRTSTLDPFGERRQTAYRLEQAIYLVFGIVESLIAIRFVLKLLGAGPEAGFSQFIYGITAPLIAPFIGLFGMPQASGSILELHSVAALVVYALVGLLIVKLARLLFGETRTGVMTRSDNTRTRAP